MQISEKEKILLKTLIFLAITVVALEAVYIFAGRWVLKNGYLLSILNRNPEKFRIEWRDADTKIPGIFDLKGVKVRWQSKRTQNYIEAEKAHVSINLISIVGGKIHFGSVICDKVSFWMRLRRSEKEAKPLDQYEPPIPGLSQYNWSEKQKIKRASPFVISFEKIKMTNVNEIWIGPFRTKCEGTAEGKIRYRIRGALKADDLKIALNNSQIQVGDEIVASKMELNFEWKLASVVLSENRGRKWIKSVSGKFVGTGNVKSINFINEALGKDSPIFFSGSGKVSAELYLKRGVLQPKSFISWQGDKLAAKFVDFLVEGNGSLYGSTEDTSKAFSLNASWKDITVSGGGLNGLKIENSEIKTSVSSPEIDFSSDGRDIYSVIESSGAVIKDLSPLNALIPPESEVKVLSPSQCTLKGRFEIQGKIIKGFCELQGSEVGINFVKQTLRGELKTKLEIKDGILEDALFDVSQSDISFKSVEVSDEKGIVTDDNWNMEIKIEKGKIKTKEPAAANFKLMLKMKNSNPVINHLVNTQIKKAKWIERILKNENIEGSGEFSIDNNRIRVKDLKIYGNDMEILSNVEIKKENIEGALYAQFHNFSTTIVFEGKKREWKWINAKSYYEKKIKDKNLIK